MMGRAQGGLRELQLAQLKVKPSSQSNVLMRLLKVMHSSMGFFSQDRRL
jgi:hypothetical protein